MGNLATKTKITKSTYEVEVLEPPTTSPNDPNAYQVIRLKNGLVALLISQPYGDGPGAISPPQSPSFLSPIELKPIFSDMQLQGNGTHEKAFVSLSINVGSYSDPEDKQGLAQLLERMLLKSASKDYPKANDFEQYLQKTGGCITSETNCEDTTFCVSVNEMLLEKVLRRLSSYFQSPVMKRESVYEHLFQLEKEFVTLFKSDPVRLQQLILGLGKPGHPSVSFSRGHAKLLRNKFTDEQIYESLIEFHTRHYSAHRMVLTLCSRLSLENLEWLVIEHFKNIPNNLLPPTHFAKFVNPYNTSKFYQLFYVKPLQNVTHITVTWSLVPQIYLYRQKPCDYIAWMLKQEGPGSLMACLRQRAWVTSIEAGTDEAYTGKSTTFSMFKIVLYLTPDGMDNVNLILDRLFSYLAFLKQEGAKEYVYNEIKFIKEKNYDKENIIKTNEDVMDISKSMLYCNSSDILTGFKLYYSFNGELIQSCMDCLVPSQCNIIIMDPRYEDSIYKEEDRYFGTEYSAPNVPSKWIKQWEKCTPYPEFVYPPPNPYISDEEEVLPPVDNKCKYPENIIHNSKCELWYKRGNVTSAQGAYLYYSFNSPIAAVSAKYSVLLDIYLAVLNFVLNKHMYQARLVGLEYSVERSICGFELKVRGMGSKLPVMVHEISKTMRTCVDGLPLEVFQSLKHEVQSDLYSCLLEPAIIIEELQKTILLQNYFNGVDKHAVIADITAPDLEFFVKELFTSLTIQNIVQGHICEEDAFRTLLKVLNNLNIGFENRISKSRTRILEIPTQDQCICAKPAEDHSKSIVRNYYQIGPNNVADYCMLEIVLKLMTQSLKDILKVKDHPPQYDLNCSMAVMFGILSFNLTVSCQASKFMTSYVNERIESFLRAFKRSIRWINEKDFNDVVMALIKEKLEPKTDLEAEVNKNFYDICNDEYNFDRVEKEIHFLQHIEAIEVAKWFYKTMKKSLCKKISFQVCGQQISSSISSKMFGKTSTSSVFRETSIASIDYLLIDEENFKLKNKTSMITDVAKYKMYLNLYPLEQCTSRFK